jgi:hypothetical protein
MSDVVSPTSSSGLAISEAGAELLAARFAVQESTVEVVGDVRGQDGFAGIWLDSNEATVHVATGLSQGRIRRLKHQAASRTGDARQSSWCT